MGWTKGEIVSEAFAELALAGYEFDLSPDEIDTGRRRLDLMMATWAGQGLQMGYALSATPDDGSTADDSGLPLFAVEAVTLNLAIRLSAGKGKAPAQATKAAAKAAYDALVSRLASEQVQEVQYPSGTPAGAGRKLWRSTGRPYMPRPSDDPLQTNPDGGLTFAGNAD